MARKTRIEFEGAFYHVITRGNHKRKVFKSEEDFRTYLDILCRYKDRYQFFLYAYVLMNNHVHLLIEAGATPLSKVLQGINQSYTMYFNRKYHLAGHLFQGRYKAILCEKNTYLLALVKYIHLNPVRALLTQTPDDYLWSSHGAYVSKKSGSELIDTGKVLPLFSEAEESARKLYRSFIGEAVSITRDDVYRTVDQRLLGSRSFIEDVAENRKVSLINKRKKHELSLSDLASGIEKEFSVSISSLCSKSRAKDIALCRKLLSGAANAYGYTGSEIAKFMRKDPAMISRHLSEKAEFSDKVEAFLLSIEQDV